MPDPGKSPLLAWPGAVQASWPDEGVPAHYGDPLREQRAGGAVSTNALAERLEVTPASASGMVRRLGELGLVSHAHLGHGAPTYHLATDADHVHLVCRDCDRVTEIGPDAIRPLITTLEERHGFETDVGHLTVFGRCADCRTAADA